MYAIEYVAFVISVYIAMVRSADSEHTAFRSAIYTLPLESALSTAKVTQCALQSVGITFGAVKLSEDDLKCDGLSRDWNLTGVQEPDVVYLMKEETAIQFVPPLLTTATNYFQTVLPFVIKDGYGYTVEFSVEDVSSYFESFLLVDTPANMAFILAFWGGQSSLGFATSTNGPWQSSIWLRDDYPIVNTGVVYQVTIRAESGGYRMSVNGVPKYLYTKAKAYDMAKIYRFSPHSNFEIKHQAHLHKIVFFTG